MSFDQPPKVERGKPYSSRIVLHFLRHSIKDTDVVSATDHDVRLSGEGRKLAKEKAAQDAALSQSVAFGSPRIRSRETAAIVMTGAEMDITGDETFEELQKKLDEGLKYGSKIGIDPRLNFNDDKNSPLGTKQYEAMTRGEYTKFIIEDSDRVAKETGDTTNSNYSYKAAQVAKIVQKYLKISSRWDELATKKDGKYSDTLERFMGSHQGVTESFLAKVIEKTEGLEARKKFIEAIGAQGFGYVEGYDVNLFTDKSGTSITISFKKDLGDGRVYSFEKEISPLILEEIIKEGSNLQ